jgi:uncharacterized protein YydD (DUF2326 family)
MEKKKKKKKENDLNQLKDEFLQLKRMIQEPFDKYTQLAFDILLGFLMNPKFYYLVPI